MRYSLLLPISEEALQTLESHLATRTFILGTTLTLADLTLYGALHQAVVSHPSSPTCNAVYMEHARRGSLTQTLSRSQCQTLL